jgi:hypothetical protein
MLTERTYPPNSELVANGAIEIGENGGVSRPSRDSPGDVPGAAEKALLHLWSRITI